MPLFNYLILAGLGAVVLILLLGLINMMRGADSARAQKLMRWRVGLQFATLLLLLAALFFAG